MTFNDNSILTDEESAKLASMKEAREQGLAKKDVDALNALKEEWEAFSAPINDFIECYNKIESSFFTSEYKDMLSDDELSQVKRFENEIKTAYQNRDEEALQTAGAEWEAYSENLKDVLDTYNSINQYPFTEGEESLLSDSDWEEIDSLQYRTDEALSDRDAEELHALKDEWNEYTSEIKENIEEKKREIMVQWSQTLDQGSSFANLLTMGTMRTSSSIEGHQIIIVTQYTTDMGISDDNIRASLESYLAMTSSVFQSGLDYLKTYIDDVSIRIEYRNVKGDVVSYKEFR